MSEDNKKEYQQDLSNNKTHELGECVARHPGYDITLNPTTNQTFNPYVGTGPFHVDFSALKIEPTKKTQRSTMFLTDLTVLDHGFIDDQGRLIGGSFHPSFEVSGEIDGAEKVVVDFSTIKKELKQFIDSSTDGFDHKLWLIEGFSNVTEERLTGHKQDRILIKTPAVSLEIPVSAIKRIPKIDGAVPSHSDHYVGLALEQFLNNIYKHQRRDTKIEVKCVNRSVPHFFIPTQEEGHEVGPLMFTYAHGLKDSTSWGCQNIGHGHLSYLVLGPSTDCYDDDAVYDLGVEIQEYLDEAYLVNQENVVHDTKKYITVSYESMTRGIFTAVLNKAINKVHVLPTETTIELIVDYVVEIFGDDLRKYGVPYIMISEGLSKGAMKYL